MLLKVNKIIYKTKCKTKVKLKQVIKHTNVEGVIVLLINGLSRHFDLSSRRNTGGLNNSNDGSIEA